MLGISRVEARQERGKNHGSGWYARLNNGDGQLMEFLDSAYGGKEQALRAAKEARARMWLSYCAQKDSLRPREENRLNKRNSSGVAGVTWGRSKSGERVYEYWVCYWRGKQYRYYIHNYGGQTAGVQAFNDALAKRKEMLERTCKAEEKQYRDWAKDWLTKSQSKDHDDLMAAYTAACRMGEQKLELDV